MSRIFLPFPVDPRIDLDELAQVDLMIEIGGEISAVASGVDVHDVDGVDGIEMAFHGQGAVGVHDAGVKTHAQDGRDAFGFTALHAFPFVIAVPGGILADFVRLFVDGRVHIDRSRLNAGFQDRHVNE